MQKGGFAFSVVLVLLLTVCSCISDNRLKLPEPGGGSPTPSPKPFSSPSPSPSTGPSPGPLTVQISIDQSSAVGTLDLTAYSLGQGGLSSQAMLHPHVSQLLETHPNAIRIFVAEYYNIYPDHELYNWTKLDKTLSNIVAIGAQPIVNISFKPKVLFPTIDQTIVDPTSYSEWNQLIAQLVLHTKKMRFNIKYWEIGNEGDIGERGGSPYLFTPENYINYYANTARAILSADPTAKVGGPALANVRSPIGSALIAAAARESVRLDFFSWHVYTNHPWSIAASIEEVKSLLNRYASLASTPTLISEWNMDLNSPNLTARFQPAFVMQTTRLFHDYRLSMSAYYHARDYYVDASEFLAFMSPAGALAMASWWNVHPQYDGLFDFRGNPRPTYRIFRWLSQFAGQELTITGTNSELNGYAIKKGNSLSV